MASAAWRLVSSFGEDHLAHGVDAVALEEHVLRADEAHALRAERDGVGDLIGRVGVRADVELAELVGHLHQRVELLEREALLAVERLGDEHLHDLRRRGLHLAGEDLAAGAVDGDELALFEDGVARR